MDLQCLIRGEWNWPVSCLNDSETQETGGIPPDPPLEAWSFGARLENRSVFNLDPRLPFIFTVETQSNEPLYNEVIGIRNDFLQPGLNYNKMYGTEPLFNEITSL